MPVWSFGAGGDCDAVNSLRSLTVSVSEGKKTVFLAERKAGQRLAAGGAARERRMGPQTDCDWDLCQGQEQ